MSFFFFRLLQKAFLLDRESRITHLCEGGHFFFMKNDQKKRVFDLLSLLCLLTLSIMLANEASLRFVFLSVSTIFQSFKFRNVEIDSFFVPSTRLIKLFRDGGIPSICSEVFFDFITLGLRVCKCSYLFDVVQLYIFIAARQTDMSKMLKRGLRKILGSSENRN